MEHAGHGDGGIDGRPSEPEGRLGDLPYDQYDQAEGVPAVRHGDRPSRTQIQIRSEAGEQRVEYTETGRNNTQLIHLCNRETVQALDPQQERA